MNAGMIGNIPEFDRFEDDWDIYYERLEQYILLHGIEEKNKVPLLISVIGTDAYSTVRDVCCPDSPKDKTFADLCELMKMLFTQQGSIYRTRALFYNATQEEGESVKDWSDRLKSLSADCQFEGNFDGILLDKFVTGIRSEKIMDKLCVEAANLTMNRALEIANLCEEENCDSDVEIVAVEMPQKRRGYRVRFNGGGHRKFGRRHGHFRRRIESETSDSGEESEKCMRIKRCAGNHGPKRFRRQFGGFGKPHGHHGPQKHHHHHHHHGHKFGKPSNTSGSESETDNETFRFSKGPKIGRCGRKFAGMKIH